jgi:hypothetical protein
MNNEHTLQKLLAGLTACLTLLIGSPHAAAVEMSVYVTPPAQIGAGSSAVRIGHTVSASSDYNNLYAGGTFAIQCTNASTLQVTGENFRSSNIVPDIPPNIFTAKKNVLTVTVPTVQPATRNVTGWSNVTQGTVLACNYRWTARARESGYNMSFGGISVPIGGGEWADGNTVDFTMVKRDGSPGGCIP